jgi:hypothetical protein
MIRIRSEFVLFKKIVQTIADSLAADGRTYLQQSVLEHYTQQLESSEDLDLVSFLGTIRVCGNYSDFTAPFYAALQSELLDEVTRFNVARSLALYLAVQNRPEQAASAVDSQPNPIAKRRLAVCIAQHLFARGHHGAAVTLLEGVVPKAKAAIVEHWKFGGVSASRQKSTFCKPLSL